MSIGVGNLTDFDMAVAKMLAEGFGTAAVSMVREQEPVRRVVAGCRACSRVAH